MLIYFLCSAKHKKKLVTCSLHIPKVARFFVEPGATARLIRSMGPLWDPWRLCAINQSGLALQHCSVELKEELLGRRLETSSLVAGEGLETDWETES